MSTAPSTKPLATPTVRLTGHMAVTGSTTQHSSSLGQDVQQSLAKAAFEQNIVIFDGMSSSGGLKVYAAPWSYAFCGKLNRLCEESYRPYDVADAVVYLHELLQADNASEISMEQVSKWCKLYGKKTTRDVLQSVDDEYFRRYNRRVIAGL